MNELDQILRALDEREIARQVGKKHDDARNHFRATGNDAVQDFTEFERTIGEYYAFHFAYAVAPGAQLPDHEAQQRAKEIVIEEYKRNGGALETAFADAQHSLNGGMRRILDIIWEALKREATWHYMEAVFDRYIRPVEYDEKVEIIRQYFDRFSGVLHGIDTRRPEKYANDYKPIIREITNQMSRNGRLFRRM